MRKTKWYDLDNVAKIFPPSSTKKDPRVFRFACTLDEDIIKEPLQDAVHDALKLFPHFSVVLKKGFFWYYLESTEKKPIIKEEKIPVCSPIYRNNSHKLLFRVHYYQKRINLEVYHVLTDGNGALEFLKTVVFYYLTYRYKDAYKDKQILLDYDASSSEKRDDSFQRYYTKTKKNKMPKEKKCYQISGEKTKIGRIKVVEGDMSVGKVLDLAHQYHTSLTSFITSVYIYSIIRHMRESDKKKPIHIMVPVNLRSFFASASARNFFCMIPVRYLPKKKEVTLKEIVSFVHKTFEKELNPKSLAIRMNGYVELERNFMARVVPLAIKNVALKIAAAAESKHITSVITNLGKVSVPSLYEEHIKSFDVLVSTGKMQLGLISYKDVLTISFTSSFIDTDIMKTFFRTLTSLGVDVVIASNLVES